MTIRIALLAALLCTLPLALSPAFAEEPVAAPDLEAVEGCDAAPMTLDPAELLSFELDAAQEGTEGEQAPAVEGELGGTGEKVNETTVICGSWLYIGCCTTQSRYRQRCTFGPEVWYNYKCSGVCRF